MTFEEAIKAMREGKKVRRKAFGKLSEDEYFYEMRPSTDSIRGVAIYDNVDNAAKESFTTSSILADDWEIVENKQKNETVTIIIKVGDEIVTKISNVHFLKGEITPEIEKIAGYSFTEKIKFNITGEIYSIKDYE